MKRNLLFVLVLVASAMAVAAQRRTPALLVLQGEGGFRCLTNPTDCSRWMVQVQPTKRSLNFGESHRRQTVDGSSPSFQAAQGRRLNFYSHGVGKTLTIPQLPLGRFGRISKHLTREPVDLLVAGGSVVTMDGERHVYDNGFVAIRGERIVAVGEAKPANLARYAAKQRIDASGHAVLPGLINTHTHIPMVLYRGIADDLDLQEWLQKYIFPAEAKNTTRDFVIAGTQLGLIEMIRGGTTTYADMYYFEDAIAEETKKAGVRGVLGETVIDFPAPDNKTWDAAMRFTESFLKQWKGDALITPAIAPHAPYTVSTAHLGEVNALAGKYDAPILTHIAEAPTETEFTMKNFNARPVPYLERIGFLSPRVLGAHVVHVNEEEIEILRRREVGVAHCPQSNMKLGSGAAPVPQMLKAGLRLGLGTDGAASNHDLSLWEEIDTAAKLHKLVTMNPTVVSAPQALEMATIGGARALHMEKEIGSLEAGKRADVIFVDLSAPHLTPMYNLYSHLVYAAKASDVSDTIVNGRVLMRNRRLLTLNEGPIKAKARDYQRRVSQSLKNNQ